MRRQLYIVLNLPARKLGPVFFDEDDRAAWYRYRAITGNAEGCSLFCVASVTETGEIIEFSPPARVRMFRPSGTGLEAADGEPD
jgi:hypothetical protein